MVLLLLIFLFHVSLSESQPPTATYPVRIPPTILNGTESSCLSETSTDINKILDNEFRKTRDVLNRDYRLRPCSCGGPGWIRVGYLNMSDPLHRCPSGWRYVANPIIGCGRQSRVSNNSVKLSVNNVSYSRVCGRMYAYQRSISNAFYRGVSTNSYSTIDSAYVSGISLTHGRVGERKHIWTFAGAQDETFDENNPLRYCPCVDATYNWTYQIPSFVGKDYFCDTGYNHYPNPFVSDPMWDGEGCGGSSSCCSFNSPPWFCKNLQYSTSDDLELRQLTAYVTENKYVSLVEIYVN